MQVHCSSNYDSLSVWFESQLYLLKLYWEAPQSSSVLPDKCQDHDYRYSLTTPFHISAFSVTASIINYKQYTGWREADW